MATHRFYAPDLHREIVALSAHEAHHAQAVMRLKSGDAAELFDGKGAIGKGTIRVTGKRECSVEVGEIVHFSRPNLNPLTLAMAIPRSPRQSFLIEKCTELGVDAIWPVTFARSVVKMSSSGIAKWRRTIIEAGKQCRTTYLPEILEPLPFEQAFNAVAKGAIQLLCDPAAGVKIADRIQCLSAGQGCVVWIGPEGGIAAAEVDQLLAQGAIKVGLGVNILRIETAAIAVAAAFALQSSSNSAN
jgi:16S rRNA (uracil1498-N3)-methyltransferase